MGPTEKLVRRAQKGDKDAFVALIEQEKHSLTRAALAILHHDEDAADAVSETALTAFWKLHTLREARYFKTWLMRILIYNAYAILRKRKPELLFAEVPDEEQQEDEMARHDGVIDIQQSLSRLAQNDRLVLTLFYLDGLSVKEIGTLLGLSESAVKTRLHRAREKFRKVYDTEEGKCHEESSGKRS